MWITITTLTEGPIGWYNDLVSTKRQAIISINDG